MQLFGAIYDSRSKNGMVLQCLVRHNSALCFVNLRYSRQVISILRETNVSNEGFDSLAQAFKGVSGDRFLEPRPWTATYASPTTSLGLIVTSTFTPASASKI